MWDMQQFYRDIQGPVTQGILVILGLLLTALSGLITWFGAYILNSLKRRFHFDAEQTKLETVKQKAEFAVKATEMAAYAQGGLSGEEKKKIAMGILEKMVLPEVLKKTPEILDAAIERMVFAMKKDGGGLTHGTDSALEKPSTDKSLEEVNATAPHGVEEKKEGQDG